MSVNYSIGEADDGGAEASALLLVQTPLDRRVLPLLDPSTNEGLFVVDLSEFIDRHHDRDVNDNDLPRRLAIEITRDDLAPALLRYTTARHKALVTPGTGYSIRQLFGDDAVLSRVEEMVFSGGGLPELQREIALNAIVCTKLYVDARWRATDQWNTRLPLGLRRVQIDLTSVDAEDGEQSDVQARSFQRIAELLRIDGPLVPLQPPQQSSRIFVDARRSLFPIFILPNLYALTIRARQSRNSLLILQQENPVPAPAVLQSDPLFSNPFGEPLASQLVELSLQFESLNAPINMFASLPNLQVYVGVLPHPMGNYMVCQSRLQRLTITHSRSPFDVPAHIGQFRELTLLERYELPLDNARHPSPQRTLMRPELTAPSGPLPVEARFTGYAARGQLFVVGRQTAALIATLSHVGILSSELLASIALVAQPLTGETRRSTERYAALVLKTPYGQL